MGMLQRVVLAAGACAALAGPAWAGDREKALAVVQEAIKAHGGEEGLLRSQHVRRTGSGFLSLMGQKVPFTDEVLMSLPGRWRQAIEVDKRLRMTVVLNGDQGWQATGGMAMAMPRDLLDEYRENLYVQWVTTLAPLTKGPFDLSTLPEIKVNGKPALGVKAVNRGHPDLKLYFDKQTHLLVKLERQAREAGVSVKKEYVYSDHKSFEGVKLPTREVISLSGQQFTELSSATYKFVSKPDAKEFGKP